MRVNCDLKLTLLLIPRDTLTSKNEFHTKKDKMWFHVKLADMHGGFHTNKYLVFKPFLCRVMNFSYLFWQLIWGSYILTSLTCPRHPTWKNSLSKCTWYDCPSKWWQVIWSVWYYQNWIGQSSFFWSLMHERRAAGEGVQQGCQASVSQSLLLSLTNHFYCFFLSTAMQQMAALLTDVQNTESLLNIKIQVVITSWNL